MPQLAIPGGAGQLPIWAVLLLQVLDQFRDFRGHAVPVACPVVLEPVQSDCAVCIAESNAEEVEKANEGYAETFITWASTYFPQVFAAVISLFSCALHCCGRRHGERDRLDEAGGARQSRPGLVHL